MVGATMLSPHLFIYSCLLFDTHKEHAMGFFHPNPNYGLIWGWKGYWFEFLGNTLHYYSPWVGGCFPKVLMFSFIQITNYEMGGVTFFKCQVQGGLGFWKSKT